MTYAIHNQVIMKQLSQLECIDLDRIREEYGDGPDKYDIQAREALEARQTEWDRAKLPIAVASATAAVGLAVLTMFAVTDPDLDRPILKERMR